MYPRKFDLQALDESDNLVLGSNEKGKRSMLSTIYGILMFILLIVLLIHSIRYRREIRVT